MPFVMLAEARRCAFASIAIQVGLLSPPVIAQSTEPPLQELLPSTVLDRMEETGRRQLESLRGWTGIRIYQAGNIKFRKNTRLKVEVAYAVPGSKTYRVLESAGSSGLVANRVIRPILDAEIESAVPKNRELTDINRKNYELQFVAFDSIENAYIFSAIPHKPHRYRLRGRIWVDGETFGIRRVRGVPSVSPSFWVRRTEFTHEYSRVGEFWLPRRHRSQSELRIFGRSTLEIDYLEYHLSEEASLQSSQATSKSWRIPAAAVPVSASQAEAAGPTNARFKPGNNEPKVK